MPLEFPTPGQRKAYVLKPDVYAIARLEDLKPIIDEVNRLAAVPAPTSGPLVYMGNVTQIFGGTPSIITGFNSLDTVAPILINSGPAVYTLTFTNPVLTENKTHISYSNGWGQAVFAVVNRNSDTELRVVILDEAGFNYPSALLGSIKVEVYS